MKWQGYTFNLSNEVTKRNTMAQKNTPKKLPPPPKPSKNTKPIEAKEPVEPSNREKGLSVVGIGASAGGLAALRAFFEALPPETGMALVVITHLHPEHESHLAELLQRSTSMPVMQVTQRTSVESNHVYVIPPNRSMLMTNTHLDTREFEEPHGQRTPIDHFFRSMASSGHSEPIAIILSGGGTDGSVGIKDVKEVGGMIMVQQPEDAEHDSMPRAALSTGLVDVILPAGALAERLAKYVQHRPKLPHDSGHLSESDVETLQRILGQVHARTGHDFSQYKRSTILRRIERRMQLNGFSTLEAYLDFLRGNDTEAHAMFNDILIGVTNFFRDRESWEALQSQVIPKLFDQHANGEEQPIRVWSIGCATGEEAYTLAMLLFEEAGRRGVRANLQVFASDLDDRSIARARDGHYPAAIEADVSAERLEKFFVREGEYYRISREVRDAVLFTNHNVMRDPPFSHQNLIACRNVLIYLQRPIQDRVFDIFHYSLTSGGFLFLGTSESAEHLPELFQVVDKSHRIYQAKPWSGERPNVPSMPFSLRRMSRAPDISTLVRAKSTLRYDDPTLLDEHHQRALEFYGPPSIIVNERYIILHVSETAGRYLHQPKGPVTGEILTMVLPELQLELRTAIFHAFENGKATVSRPVSVQFNGHRRRVFVTVRPRPEDTAIDRMGDRQALVVFIEDELHDPDQAPADMKTPHTEAERDTAIWQLQSEVQRLREQLQITLEEYESSNEEMKAANEELQSINEEYRSATEELETSKEELQSVNEELQTVNNEMRNKLDETSRAHQELENLLGATEIATLYLDRELRIQRYTAGMQELFSILSVDRGRRISDLTNKLEYDRLVEDAEQVLRNLVPVERELQKRTGNWFLMRLRPYRTNEDRIEGVVITFIDITRLKAVEDELMRAKAALEDRVQVRTRELAQANQQTASANLHFSVLFQANPIPTALIRMEDEVFLNVNVEFLVFFNLHPDDVVGHRADEFNFELGLGKWTRAGLAAELARNSRIQDFEAEIKLHDGSLRNVLISMQSIPLDDTPAVIITFIDITERARAEREIRSLASDLTVAEQEERRRISQILHDDLQQRIFAVKMQMSLLRDAYRNNDPRAAQVDFDQLEEQLNRSISITRNLSIDLSPAVLQGEGLADALVWLAAQMRDQYGLQVSIQTNDISTRFEDTLRILLFQAVREALFNVVKHGQISQAKVSISRMNEEVQITVSDDGRGFDTTHVFDELQESGGLMNIRHRLQLMGCELEIRSQPGQGTRVIIHVPSKQVYP